MKQMHNSCFTLTEMLVVIAIIGILASLLMPSLQKAMNSARSLNCLNNQKNVLTAQYLYSGDYNGYMVVSSPYGSANETFVTLLTRAKSNTGLLSPGEGYLQWSSLVCPSNSDNRKLNNIWFSTYGMWCYKGISRGACYNKVGNIFGEKSLWPSNFCSVHIKSSRAKSPSKTFILADTVVSNSSVNAGKQLWAFYADCAHDSGGITNIHQGKANCAFIDGHCSALSPPQMEDSFNMITSYVDYPSLMLIQ